MTDQTRHQREPSKRQMGLLRKLAVERGRTFAVPRSFAEADAEIKALLAAPRPGRGDRRREMRELRDDMAGRAGDAASVRRDETDGYGSSARWS
jgi:hypothetical protein